MYCVYVPMMGDWDLWYQPLGMAELFSWEAALS